ncbi:Hpt domain-containing protein [Flavivirga algicola]|uniref:HPt domain-containing protein n=1 Tax=Flavivirga algicola TaxID=2729136 RepID=A0ABX1RTP4_9FLAO|nr:Hpt domain-containing protein [Flavivirga algicola]NMH86922.1 hypothetical protein [Flavivirga algicola]
MIESNYRYINLELLRENTFDDASIMMEIMELFLEIIDEYAEALTSQVPAKKWESLFQATHKIKPNINMFGVSKLKSNILQLESNFKNEQNLETTVLLVSDCLTILKEVKREIQTELRAIDNNISNTNQVSISS